MNTLLDRIFSQLAELIEKIEHIKHEVHHMGKALDALTAQVAINNTLIQQAVNLITTGGTVVGEDPVAVQALADQLAKDDAALAGVLATKVPPAA